MRRTLSLVVLAGLAMTAGCSSSSSSTASSPSTPAASDTATPAASSAAATPAPAATFAAGPVPAVTAPTDLATQPVIAAGTGAPPTVLTGKDLVVGTGATATPASTVTVQYVGALFADGKKFDASWDRGGPVPFPLNQVIPGFSQGIAGMKVGGRRELVIPPALGYGAQGAAPAIPPNATLTFVIDLIKVA